MRYKHSCRFSNFNQSFPVSFKLFFFKYFISAKSGRSLRFPYHEKPDCPIFKVSSDFKNSKPKLIMQSISQSVKTSHLAKNLSRYQCSSLATKLSNRYQSGYLMSIRLSVSLAIARPDRTMLVIRNNAGEHSYCFNVFKFFLSNRFIITRNRELYHNLCPLHAYPTKLFIYWKTVYLLDFPEENSWITL